MDAALDVDRLQRELEAIFGPRRVSLRPVDLDTYSRDMWPRMLLGYREGRPVPARPYAVVWPEHVREVVSVVKLASAVGLPIVPYGGGSGVCGGAVPLRGGITIDTKRMQALDQAPFRHLGVEPKEQKILALKSTVHFRGDFQPLAEEILVTIAPGGHLADSSKFPYQRLRAGLRLMPLGAESKGPLNGTAGDKS